MVSFPRFWERLSGTLVAGLISACGGGDLLLPGGGAPEAPAPAAIRVFDGDGQTGEVGEPLSVPLVVLVTDAQGDPVEGAPVVFELTSAGDGAEIEPTSDQTNASGFAEAHVVLGNKVGLQTGEARVPTGATSTLKTSFTAIAHPDSPDNRPPHADYNWHCQGLSCQFTDASSDDDGNVIAWSWQFGDGGISNQTEPEHLYPAPGTYLVTLTVTDNDGSSDETTAHVEVSGPAPPPESNKAPKAEFEVHCSGLTCAFVDKSKDDDGAVVAWQWNFGDGASSNERNPVHTYDHPDKYEVLLIVTDDAGDVDAKTRDADAKD
jgi:PKD repeat protein